MVRGGGAIERGEGRAAPPPARTHALTAPFLCLCTQAGPRLVLLALAVCVGAACVQAAVAPGAAPTKAAAPKAAPIATVVQPMEPPPANEDPTFVDPNTQKTGVQAALTVKGLPIPNPLNLVAAKKQRDGAPLPTAGITFASQLNADTTTNATYLWTWEVDAMDVEKGARLAAVRALPSRQPAKRARAT